MARVHIALQDGFTGQTVIIRINGQERYQKQVKTKFQIGFADSFEIDLDEQLLKIEVLLPAEGVSDNFEVQISADTYIGISIDQGKVIHRISSEPFGYL